MMASGISRFTMGSRSQATMPSWVTCFVQSSAIISAPASQTWRAASSVGVMKTSVSSCQILYRPMSGRSTAALMALICSGELALIPAAPAHLAAWAIFTTMSSVYMGSSFWTWQETIRPLRKPSKIFLFLSSVVFISSPPHAEPDIFPFLCAKTAAPLYFYKYIIAKPLFIFKHYFSISNKFK